MRTIAAAPLPRRRFRARGVLRAAGDRRRETARAQPEGDAHGDPTQSTRDRYRRLLAYVWLPGGKDLGFQLLAGGYARVYIFRTPFQRLAAYRTTESRGRALRSSVWRCSGSPVRPSRRSCDPSYPNICIPPHPPDLDCSDVPYTNFAVRGDDPHGFDRDGDGVGCER
jgi:micrococcal nuclease